MIEFATHAMRGKKEKMVDFFINSIVDITKREKIDEMKLSKGS